MLYSRPKSSIGIDTVAKFLGFLFFPYTIGYSRPDEMAGNEMRQIRATYTTHTRARNAEMRHFLSKRYIYFFFDYTSIVGLSRKVSCI